MSTTPAPMSSPADLSRDEVPTATYSLTNRYVDAYRVVNFQLGLGKLIKKISIGVGGAIVIIALGSASEALSPQQGMLGPLTLMVDILVGLAGAGIGGIGFILGILVCSGAQILQATLDSAVNSSPFLNNNERAGIMSL